MRSIVMLMLALDVAMLLTVAFSILRKPSVKRPQPIWTSLGLATLVAAMVSFEIGDRHAPDAGNQLLQFGAAVLLGMTITLFLVAVRENQGKT